LRRISPEPSPKEAGPGGSRVCVKTEKGGPQRLKPSLICDGYGTAEAMP
jgi:hypothetical protein